MQSKTIVATSPVAARTVGVPLRQFLSGVLLLHPSVYDRLTEYGITNDIQECTTFSSEDDWKGILSDKQDFVAVKKLTRLSELLQRFSVDEIGKIRTLAQFNAVFESAKAENRKKRKSHDQAKSRKRNKISLLRMADVVAPTPKNGTPVEVMTPPISYSAVARGTMYVDQDGSHSFRGKWAMGLELFAAGPSSDISFQLDSCFVDAAPPAARDCHKARLIPTDSSHYKGSFKVVEPDGSFDVFDDTQIVMKFRKNSSEGYNIYGKGVNIIGIFNVVGTLTMKGDKIGQVELYRTYESGPNPDAASTREQQKQSSLKNIAIGTPVRKFFKDSEQNGRYFVGYVVDIESCDDEDYDGQHLPAPIFKVLYDDGDSEDFWHEEIQPFVENAYSRGIFAMGRKELGEWEAGVMKDNQQKVDMAKVPVQKSQPQIHGKHYQTVGKPGLSETPPTQDVQMQVKESTEIFTGVLLKYLEHKDRNLLEQAKKIILKDRTQHQQTNGPGSSVHHSTGSHLRALIGESYWNKAKLVYALYMKEKRQKAGADRGSGQDGEATKKGAFNGSGMPNDMQVVSATGTAVRVESPSLHAANTSTRGTGNEPMLDGKGEHEKKPDENGDESVNGNMGKETRETELLSDDELEERFDKLVSSAKRETVHYEL